MEEEKAMIRASKVLIPFSISGTVNVVLGPLPSLHKKLEQLKKFFFLAIIVANLEHLKTNPMN